MNAAIRVLVVDDDPLVRAGLRMILDAAPGLTVVAEAADGTEVVAAAVGRGKSNSEISDELFMSVATVKAHLSSILTKLDLNNRTQIALLAHDAGLTG